MAAPIETAQYQDQNYGFPWTPDRRYPVDTLYEGEVPEEIKHLTHKVLGVSDFQFPLGEKLRGSLELVSIHLIPLSFILRVP